MGIEAWIAVVPQVADFDDQRRVSADPGVQVFGAIAVEIVGGLHPLLLFADEPDH